MYQLTYLRSQFLLLKKDLGDVDNELFVSWVRNVQQYIYRRLKDTDESYYAKTQTYLVASGSQSLPSDFGDITSMNTGFYLLDDNGSVTARKLFPTNYGSSQPGFYLSGRSTVSFFNISQPQQYILRYTPKTVGVESINDYFTLDGTVNTIEIVPDDFLEFIIKALDVYYTQWDEEVSAESFADARLVRVMDDLFEQLQRTPKVFDMNPFNRIF